MAPVAEVSAQRVNQFPAADSAPDCVAAAGALGEQGNESAFYEFTPREADILEAATNELEEMSRMAVQHVVDENLYAEMGISETAVPLVRSSWEAQPTALYGRFDLAWCGEGEPKLLEYNADTPTSLLEAAVVQWYWLEDAHPGRDQLKSFDRKYPVIGSWVIGHRAGDAAAGIGIRESDIPITTNLSQFVPHLIQ